MRTGAFAPVESAAGLPADCRQVPGLSSAPVLSRWSLSRCTYRGVGLRPPYMHAGQFASLAEVVRHYADAPRLAAPGDERRRFDLPAADAADLAAFLGSLAGEVVEEAPGGGPRGP